MAKKKKKKKGQGSGAHRAKKPGRRAKGLRRNPGVAIVGGGGGGKRRAKGVRRLRTNAPFSMNGAMSIVKDVPRALVDAGIIIVGEAATRKIASVVPFGEQNVATRILKQGVIGLGIGIAASMVNRRYGYTALVAGLVTPLRTATALIPKVGPQVAGYGLGRYVGRNMGRYERQPVNAQPTRREMLTGGSGDRARNMGAYTSNRSAAGARSAAFR